MTSAPAPLTPWSPAVRWTLIVGLVVLWFVQYFVVVPMWLIFRFFVALLQAAVTVGVWGMLLLFIPVIGWIILLAMWANHRGQKKVLRELEGADRINRFLFRPWFLEELERRQGR